MGSDEKGGEGNSFFPLYLQYYLPAYPLHALFPSLQALSCKRCVSDY